MKPTPAVIRKNLRYDPATGLLWWIAPFVHRRMDRPVGVLDSRGYLVVKFFGRMFKAHRLAYVLMMGRWPRKHMDHMNGCPADNRWKNLRLATGTQNRANSIVHKNNTSRLKGAHVSAHGGWQSAIKVNRKSIYLGHFSTPEAAHAAYIVAAKKYFGEFARAA